MIAGGIIAIVQDYWAQKAETLPRLCNEVSLEMSRRHTPGPMLKADTVLDFVSKAFLSVRVPGKRVDEVLLSELTSSRFKREDEVMTLVFDLFYFFRGDIRRHLEMYWSYWLGLPGIHADRHQIVTYVVRSCCALAAHYFDSPRDAIVASIKPTDLLEGLRSVIGSSKAFTKEAVETVLGHLGNQANEKRIYQEVLDFLPLVCTTLGVLTFSDTREAMWKGRDEKARARMARCRRELLIDNDALNSAFNPLELVAMAAGGMKPNEQESSWIFTMLDILSDGYAGTTGTN